MRPALTHLRSVLAIGLALLLMAVLGALGR